MKKGFAYLTILILLAILLAAAGYFTSAALRWRQTAAADLAAIRAGQMAESAVVYAAAQSPNLLRNEFNSPDREALLILEGFDYRVEDLGFRIVQNKNTLYFIGYAGQLPEPQAVKILYSTPEGKPQPW